MSTNLKILKTKLDIIKKALKYPNLAQSDIIAFNIRHKQLTDRIQEMERKENDSKI